MSGSPKEKLQREEDATESQATDEREVYMRDGRKVVVSDADQLVEIRSPSGMLELRIKLTEEGPVLQMESVRMQLKATESVEIAAKQVSIAGSEQVAVVGKDVSIDAEEDLDVEAKNDVRVVGKMIHLN